jgi:hypothetical protein
MAGLETIALAVAHLESIQGGTGNDEQPLVTVLSDSSVRKESPYLPSLKLHGRMVSDDSIYEGHPVSHVSSVAEPRISAAPADGKSSHDDLPQRPSIDTRQWTTSKRKSNVKQTIVHTTMPDVIYPEQDSKTNSPDHAGILLEKISMVNEDLVEFFTLMEKLQQLALPDGMKPAEVPKPDEIIYQVQRYDVLLGRGGETNHHVGNIQYRQLVKACQPAYLAAKRRDKPRIAVAIVQVVRAHSGRFLKKHPNDSTWGDVGSIRAREKTSQALREGAPELRGVESQRSQLLVEAVESSIDRKLKNVMDSSNVEFSFDPRQMHLSKMHDVSNGKETHPGLNPRSAAKDNHSASAQSTIASSNAISRPLLIPPKGLSHYPMHQHVPMPIVPGPIYYHHPHGHVMYHPNPGMDTRYHHVYSDKRAMVLPSVSEPPKKRQQFLQKSTTQVQVQTGSQIPDPVTLLQHKNLSYDGTGAAEKAKDTASISADNSEEERVVVRSASPASSTSSSKNTSTCRGPRLKLLKQRFEEGATSAIVE